MGFNDGRGTCKTCGEEVRWVKTENGKNMPIDPEPSSAGGFVLEERELGTVAVSLTKLYGREASNYRGQKYTSHFQTCPQAKQHRRPA